MSVPDFAAAWAAGRLPWVEIDPRTLLRLTKLPSTEPYWGKGIKYRFDDPEGIFGVNYAAQTLEAAFAECILQQQGCYNNDKNQWDIAKVRVEERYIVHFDRVDITPLRLVNLSGPDLAKLGLNNDLSALDDYTEPMQVSAALHHYVPEADGIQYVSRRCNTRLAVALFERSQVRCQPNSRPLTDHPDYPRLIDMFGINLLPETDAPD